MKIVESKFEYYDKRECMFDTIDVLEVQFGLYSNKALNAFDTLIRKYDNYIMVTLFGGVYDIIDNKTCVGRADNGEIAMWLGSRYAFSLNNNGQLENVLIKRFLDIEVIARSKGFTEAEKIFKWINAGVADEYFKGKQLDPFRLESIKTLKRHMQKNWLELESSGELDKFKEEYNKLIGWRD